MKHHRFTLSPLLVGVRSRAQWLWLRSETAIRFRCLPLLRSLRSLPNGRHLQLQAVSTLRLSPHRPRLVEKSGVARSGRGYAPSLARSYLFCAVSAKPSALRPISLQNNHRFTLSPLLLGVARSGSLVAPCGRSAAFPLPRFSPSLATLGHLPPRGFYVSFSGVRAAIPAPPMAQPTYRHARKAVGSVFVRCRQSRPLGAQRTSDRKKWGPPPHFNFLSDNRFALSLRSV